MNALRREIEMRLRLGLSSAMTIGLIPHLRRLFAMVSLFYMCGRKVSNLIYYMLVILFLLTTTASNIKC